LFVLFLLFLDLISYEQPFIVLCSIVSLAADYLRKTEVELCKFGFEP